MNNDHTHNRIQNRKLKIDSELSHSSNKSRKLEKMNLNVPDHILENDIQNWDQFEVNYKKFGVVSTYDEELYTTKKVHEEELSKDQIERAKLIEQELLNKETPEEQGDDEEKLFGAVVGSGRYKAQDPLDKKNKSQEKSGYVLNKIVDGKKKKPANLNIQNKAPVEEKKVASLEGLQIKEKRDFLKVSEIYFVSFSSAPRDRSFAIW